MDYLTTCLKYEASTSGYSRIIFNDFAKAKTGIAYVDLRPETDVLGFVDGRRVLLNNLCSDSDLMGVRYACDLTSAVLAGRELSFDTGTEGARTGRVVVSNDALLAVSELERRLSLCNRNRSAA